MNKDNYLACYLAYYGPELGRIKYNEMRLKVLELSIRHAALAGDRWRLQMLNLERTLLDLNINQEVEL